MYGPQAELMRKLGSGPVPDRYGRPGEQRSVEEMSEAEKLEEWRESRSRPENP
jgi:hypothetical protein